MKWMLPTFVLLGLLNSTALAQQLVGKIASEKGEPLEGIIYLKNPVDSQQIIDIFTSDSKGNFDFRVEGNPTKILFEVRVMGFSLYADSILNPTEKKYLFDIVLLPQALELEEVVVARKRQVVVKNDTTDFYADAFLTGTERKVEDLLKRLPGIEVSENGSLRYMGKTVQSVQMNGDDLFGEQYALGTKNIPVDLVEKVQAIDNFSENPLLRGIEDSRAVSLNLVLKKSKAKFVADGRLGLGIDTDSKMKRDVDLSVLAFNNQLKSFGTASTNNIGINRGLYDYFTGAKDVLENERPFVTQKILPDGSFSATLDNQNARINSLYTGSYNLLFRLTPKISVKASVYYLKDDIKQKERITSTFLSENITYDDQQDLRKTPVDKEAHLKLTYAINSKSLLVVDSDVRHEKTLFNSSIIQNDSRMITNQLRTNLYSWKNKSTFTVRLKGNQAIQFMNILATFSTPQTLTANTTNSQYVGDRQGVTNARKSMSNEFVYFTKVASSQVRFVLGNQLGATRFMSDFTNRGTSVLDFQNEFALRQNVTFSSLGMVYVKNGLKVSPKIGLDRVTNSVNYVEEASIASDVATVVKPAVDIEYSLGAFSSLRLEAKRDYVNIGEQHLFQNPVFQGNRTTARNDLTLNLQTYTNYQVNYRYKDAYKLFTTFAGLGYRADQNAVINRLDIDPNFTTLTFFRTPVSISTYTGTLGVEQFVSAIKTSVRFFSLFTRFSYLNVINDSGLRKNTTFSQTHTLFFRTVFDIPFALENNITVFRNISETNDLRNNLLTGLSTTTKLIYKPSQYFLVETILNRTNPSLGNSQHYHFLDVEISYKPKEEPRNIIYEYRLTGRNLLGTQFYREFTNSDFVTTQYQSNLLRPFLMFSVSARL